MQNAIIGKKYLVFDKVVGTGAVLDPLDKRDLVYDKVAFGAAPINWEEGFDVENDLKINIPIKNQDGSSSCVGQAWSYYTAVINAKEVGEYDEVSAKAFYSQFFLPGGGAYLRSGGKLVVNWGAVGEIVVPSYDDNKAPSEAFITDKTWKTKKIDEVAEILQAKEYRTIEASENMDLFAAAIRDNLGVVGGLYGTNNGTWGGYEPVPPEPSEAKWGHALYFGKFGIDHKGKYIATPNSWGKRGGNQTNYPDGWQKLRKNYFSSGNMFNPWTLTDKPNFGTEPSKETLQLMKKNEKNFIIEAEGAGRKGIIVDGMLRIITKDRVSPANTYKISVDGGGAFVKTKTFEEMPKGKNF